MYNLLIDIHENILLFLDLSTINKLIKTNKYFYTLFNDNLYKLLQKHINNTDINIFEKICNYINKDICIKFKYKCNKSILNNFKYHFAKYYKAFIEYNLQNIIYDIIELLYHSLNIKYKLIENKLNNIINNKYYNVLKDFQEPSEYFSTILYSILIYISTIFNVYSKDNFKKLNYTKKVLSQISISIILFNLININFKNIANLEYIKKYKDLLSTINFKIEEFTIFILNDKKLNFPKKFEKYIISTLYNFKINI
tara:strand:- start:1382 stop:2143 length:762 start_codon:yes stop_codon:yes gene_type:complete